MPELNSLLYKGEAKLPDDFEVTQLTKTSKNPPNIHLIIPPREDGLSWAAGLTLSTVSKNPKFSNPFYSTSVFAGTEESEKEQYFLNPSGYIEDRVFGRRHMIVDAFVDAPMLYIEATKRWWGKLFEKVNTSSGIYSGGLEKSLRRTEGNHLCIDLGKKYVDGFKLADEFMMENAEKESQRLKKEGKSTFNIYEEFRRLLPIGYIANGAIIHTNNNTRKIGTYFSQSKTKEDVRASKALLDYVEKRSYPSKKWLLDAPEFKYYKFDEGDIKMENLVEMTNDPRTIKSIMEYVIWHQAIRNRQQKVRDRRVTNAVMSSPEIHNNPEIRQAFFGIREELGEEMLDLSHENKEYGILVGQLMEGYIEFPTEIARRTFIQERVCNGAQGPMRARAIKIEKIWKDTIWNKDHESNIDEKITRKCIMSDEKGEPMCPEFTIIKDPKKRKEEWDKCRSSLTENARGLYDFYQARLEELRQVN